MLVDAFKLFFLLVEMLVSQFLGMSIKSLIRLSVLCNTIPVYL